MNYVTAVSKATKLSYVLGKHEWTISNDDYECGKGKLFQHSCVRVSFALYKCSKGKLYTKYAEDDWLQSRCRVHLQRRAVNQDGEKVQPGN